MYHKQLANGQWFYLSQIDQMANIGSEVYRAIKNQAKGKEFYEPAFDRALELFDLTLADKRRRTGWKEIARIREFFCSLFFGGNEFGITADYLNKYFFQFALAARAKD